VYGVVNDQNEEDEGRRQDVECESCFNQVDRRSSRGKRDAGHRGGN
jgi:hypothetical protein